MDRRRAEASRETAFSADLALRNPGLLHRKACTPTRRPTEHPSFEGSPGLPSV